MNVTAIFIAVVSTSGFWSLLQLLLKRRTPRRRNKFEEVKEELKEIRTLINTLTSKLDDNDEITVSFARDRLNHLSNRYITLGHIPKEEYVSFVMLGEAYTKNHNSEVATRYEQAKALPRK